MQVILCCVPVPRKLHFLYLKGRATEIHSGTEFSGNFDILMLGWNYYFIRIQVLLIFYHHFINRIITFVINSILYLLFFVINQFFKRERSIGGFH